MLHLIEDQDITYGATNLLQRRGGMNQQSDTGEGMRLFCLYNRAYNAMCVFAPDVETAKRMALRAGHSRKAMFRRVQEITVNSPDMTEEEAAALQRALDRNATGIGEFINGNWRIKKFG